MDESLTRWSVAQAAAVTPLLKALVQTMHAWQP
jgi:hypothetical protein